MAWQAAPPELLGPQDLQECTEQAYQEPPLQVHMERTLPYEQKAEDEEEEHTTLVAAQVHSEVSTSPAISKSTLRRRRRQQVQTHLAEMQHLTASKEYDRSAAGMDTADQEE